MILFKNNNDNKSKAKTKSHKTAIGHARANKETGQHKASSALNSTASRAPRKHQNRFIVAKEHKSGHMYAICTGA